MTKPARFTAAVLTCGALGLGLGGAGVAADGDVTTNVAKPIVHQNGRCPLDGHEQYLEALRKSAAARDH